MRDKNIKGRGRLSCFFEKDLPNKAVDLQKIKHV